MKVTTSQNLAAETQGRKILFITTKNIDYIRNTQNLEFLMMNDNVVYQLYSDKKNYILRLLSVYFKILSTKVSKYELVFIGFLPQLVLPFFSWKFKQPVYIDVFISLYDTLVNDRKQFSENNIVARFSKWLDKKALRKADKIIVDTFENGKYFAGYFDIDSDKMEVLYFEADKEIYMPRKQSKRGDLQNKFVVLYFGSILPLQGVEVILSAIESLKEESDIFFQMIGPVGEDVYKGDNVEYIPWLSQRDLATYIANADLCLAGHFNNSIGKASRSIAGKALIYDAMKKQIILGDNLANRELFSDDEWHHFVEMGNANQLTQLIYSLRGGSL
jgi:glycosyltransferase involved in cell wall biosynthesis